MEEEDKTTAIPAPEQPEEKHQPSAEAGEEQLSFKSFLVGDILSLLYLRRRCWLLVMLVVFGILYIGNRYACQQQIIAIDRMKKELTNMKYNALTRSSELTEKSRQSKIEEYVSKEKSTLQTSTNPPYLIK